MKKLLQIPVLVGIMLALTACTALEEHPDSVRLATMYATIKVVDEDPAKATRVEEIATDVRAYASGEKQLTVDLLVAEIRDQVRWDRLDAADRLLVDALLNELKLQLEKRLGVDVLPEDLRLAVDTVAEWVIQAARMT